MKLTTVKKPGKGKAVKKLLSYAEQVNATYHSDEDNFVTIPERLEEMFTKDPELEEIFKALAEGIVSAYNWSSFEEMTKNLVGMGVKEYYPASIIDINDTMQRNPDQENLINIVAQFTPGFLNRVRTYKDSQRNDGKVERQVAWDGQHTTLALYIIGKYGFGLSDDEILIPLDEYPGDDRAEIRRRFVEFNSGKTSKKLDNIDLYKQYVAAYKHDGIEEWETTRCYTMQTYFEKYGHFATHEKFGDDTRAGAWSRMTEVFNRNFPVEVFERVMFYHSITNNDKAYVPLEIDNMSHFFRQCMYDGIKVTDKYIEDIAKILDVVTDNTWAKGSKKHEKVIAAYKTHVTKEVKAGRLQKGKTYRCNQTLVGPDWIKQVLANNGFKHKLPAFEENFEFDVETLS